MTKAAAKKKKKDKYGTLSQGVSAQENLAYNIQQARQMALNRAASQGYWTGDSYAQQASREMQANRDMAAILQYNNMPNELITNSTSYGKGFNSGSTLTNPLYRDVATAGKLGFGAGILGGRVNFLQSNIDKMKSRRMKTRMRLRQLRTQIRGALTRGRINAQRAQANNYLMKSYVLPSLMKGHVAKVKL